MKVHPLSVSPSKQAWDFTVSKTSPLLIDENQSTIKVLVSFENGELNFVEHVSFSYCYSSRSIFRIIASLPDSNILPDAVKGVYAIKKVANYYGFYYYNGDWIHEDLIDFNGASVDRYHSGTSVSLTTMEDDWSFGIEVEKVDEYQKQRGTAKEVLIKTGWRKEQDGSLPTGGFELISPIMPLYNTDVITEAIEGDFRLKDALNGEVHDSCGGHFTVSNTALTSRQILQRIKYFAPIIYAMYSKRVNNRYCKVVNWQTYFTGSDKYRAFYIKNDSLLEIRIPTAYENVKQIKWRIGLMRLILSDVYSKMGFVTIVKKMLDGKSLLSKHMLSVYSKSDLLKMLIRACNYSCDYMPIAKVDVLRTKAMLEQLLEETESIPNV
jgi:hypothetical protein